MRAVITKLIEVDVVFLQASCGVRYWEDASVDGVADESGDLIPCRNGDNWKPLIAVDTGVIRNWTPGKTAEIHYKVCDDGTYTLLDGNLAPIKQVSGYVPKIMCPEENGYGDYVIMKVDAEGRIANWHPDLGSLIDDEE